MLTFILVSFAFFTFSQSILFYIFSCLFSFVLFFVFLSLFLSLYLYVILFCFIISCFFSSLLFLFCYNDNFLIFPDLLHLVLLSHSLFRFPFLRYSFFPSHFICPCSISILMFSSLFVLPSSFPFLSFFSFLSFFLVLPSFLFSFILFFSLSEFFHLFSHDGNEADD